MTATITEPIAAEQGTNAESIEVKLIGLKARLEQIEAQQRNLRNEATELRSREGRAIAKSDEKLAKDTRTRLREIADTLRANDSALDYLENEIASLNSALETANSEARKQEADESEAAYFAALEDASNAIVEWFQTIGKQKQETLMAAMERASRAEKATRDKSKPVTYRFYEHHHPANGVRALLPNIEAYCAGKVFVQLDNQTTERIEVARAERSDLSRAGIS